MVSYPLVNWSTGWTNSDSDSERKLQLKSIKHSPPVGLKGGCWTFAACFCTKQWL